MLSKLGLTGAWTFFYRSSKEVRQLLSVMFAASKKRSGLLELRIARKHNAQQRFHVCPVCSEICRTATCHQFDETEVVVERKIVLVEQDQLFETAESLQEEIRSVQEEVAGELEQDELSEKEDGCSQVSGVEPFEDPLELEEVNGTEQIEENSLVQLEQDELSSSEDDSDQEQEDTLQQVDEHQEVSEFLVEIKERCSSCDEDTFVLSAPLVHREDKLVSDYAEESTTELLESHQRRNDELEGYAAARPDAGLESSSEEELERFNQPSPRLAEAKELLVGMELMDQSEEDRRHRFRPIRSDSSSSLDEDWRSRSEPDLDRIDYGYHQKKVVHNTFTYKGSDVETFSSVSRKIMISFYQVNGMVNN